MKITFEAHALHLDEEALVNAIAVKVSKHFQELGQHVADVAAARAPVGKGRPHVSRQTERVAVRNISDFDGDKAAQASYIAYFGGGSQGEAIKSFRQHLGKKSSTNPNLTRFFRRISKSSTARQQSPTHVQLKGNTIVGAFAHQPGTLRKSIHFVGVRREDNRVIATVRASAPYAMAVHDGFKHKGGANKKGTVTSVKGQPFLKNALVNIRDRLSDASAYEG